LSPESEKDRKEVKSPAFCGMGAGVYNLFGPEVPVNHHFLRGLKPSRIKTVFRKKALLVHPDRLSSVDEYTREQYTRLFVETKWAYDHLRRFCEHRDKGKKTVLKTGPGPRAARKSEPFQKTWYFTGGIPKRKLLFGEFLFYSRVVSWDAFIKSIVLQRKGRPRFGAIAENWKYLTGQEINTLVLSRKFSEMMGDTAMRMGMMNGFQVKTVLNYQRSVQRPIGEYFIENGYISNSGLEMFLRNFQSFNEQFSNKR
jgi:curved DNA-binding protein CbpA